MTTTPLTLEIQVPATARLVLRTDDDVEVIVTPEHLRRLGYTLASPAYQRFCDQLSRALGVQDIDDAPEWANQVRYMVECALHYRHDFDYSAHPDDPTNDDTAFASRARALLRSLVVEEDYATIPSSKD